VLLSSLRDVGVCGCSQYGFLLQCGIARPLLPRRVRARASFDERRGHVSFSTQVADTAFEDDVEPASRILPASVLKPPSLAGQTQCVYLGACAHFVSPGGFGGYSRVGHAHWSVASRSGGALWLHFTTSRCRLAVPSSCSHVGRPAWGYVQLRFLLATSPVSTVKSADASQDPLVHVPQSQTDTTPFPR